MKLKCENSVNEQLLKYSKAEHWKYFAASTFDKWFKGGHGEFGPTVQTSSKLDIISIQMFQMFWKHF